MSPEELQFRLSQLSHEQRAALSAFMEILLDVVRNPQLPAMLVRVIPSKPEAATETVVAYCLSHSLDAGAAMLHEFAAARTAMALAEQLAGEANQQRH